MLVLLIIFGLFLPAIYFAACCVIAFWLAFGNSHFLIRVVGFSAAAYSLAQFAGWFLEAPIAGPAIVGISLIATATASLRWMDYRWIGFSANFDREALDRLTGKSIEEWFERFDAMGGRTWSHAQLRAHLRERGLDNDLQKLIARGYEIYIGREEAAITNTNERLYVDPIRRSVMTQILTAVREQRSSIVDWIYASVLVAALATLVRRVPGDWTNGNVIMIVFAIAVVLSMLNVVVATNCLGLAKQSRLVWLYFALFAGTVFFALNAIGLARMYQFMVLLLFIQIVITGLFTAIGLNILRQQGYRIVPVRREPSNLFVLAAEHIQPGPQVAPVSINRSI